MCEREREETMSDLASKIKWDLERSYKHYKPGGPLYKLRVQTQYCVGRRLCGEGIVWGGSCVRRGLCGEGVVLRGGCVGRGLCGGERSQLLRFCDTMLPWRWHIVYTNTRRVVVASVVDYIVLS